jgi:hypothetical protein
LVFGFPHRIHRLVQVTKHMKPVVQDRRPGSPRLGHGAEWLPHVHQLLPDPPAPGLPDEVIEQGHAFGRPVDAAERDRLLALEVADWDAIDMTLARRELVDADDARPRLPGSGHLLDQATCAADGFFPGPRERDDLRLGIATDADNDAGGDGAGKPVRIPEFALPGG